VTNPDNLASPEIAVVTATPSVSSAPEAPKGDGRLASTRPHTAVVYFHGMGSQKRYQEISRLVDCLDKYSYANRETTGRIYEIKAEVETPRGSLKKDVTCVRSKRVLGGVRNTAAAEAGITSEAWFYEAYWAPLTAGGVPGLEVLRWILRQIPYPIAAMRTPWRLRARLRRSHLFRLCSPQLGSSEKGSIFHRLLLDYDAFESPGAWRDFPKGSFDDFVEFVRKGHDGDPDLAQFLELANKWWRTYHLAELGYVVVLVTIALAVALTVATTVYAIVLGLHFLSGIHVPWLPPDLLNPSAKNIAAILAAIGAILGVNSFLRDYLGDVQMWTTYEETDVKYQKRNDILEASTALLQHVLADNRCTRVVVVAHSLGTAIALDSLLQLGRFNRARPASKIPLNKIDLMITMGSPIDKIHYFFESYAGKYHRYNRLVEDLRGDIGTPPFTNNRNPQVHWINVWDRADLVSGSLETPSNRKLVTNTVDNLEVSSFGFPAPAASHSAYFEHREVLGILFGAIYGGQYSFKNAPLVEKEGYDYESQQVGFGRGLFRTRVFHLLWILLPWSILGAVLCARVHASRAEFWFELLIYAILTITVLGYLLGKPWHHRAPV
jgi:hypothetical protein